MNDKKITLDHRRTRVAKLIKIDEDAYTFLEKIKKDNKVSMNEIINQIIISFMEKNDIEQVSEHSPVFSREIRINLTEEEYSFLQNSAKSHGFTSVTKETRWRIKNTIYNDKFYNNIEMKELASALVDINKLGRNINSLVAILKERLGVKFNIDLEKMSDVLNDIYLQIKKVNGIITEYKTRLDRRV